MKPTMLYIAEYEKDVQSFLKYLNDKLTSENRMSKFDLRCNCLETDDYMIIAKSFYQNRLGAGYGYVKYFAVSSKLGKYRDSHVELTEKQKYYLDTILMHTREDTKEISELEMLYLLGLV